MMDFVVAVQAFRTADALIFKGRFLLHSPSFPVVFHLSSAPISAVVHGMLLYSFVIVSSRFNRARDSVVQAANSATSVSNVGKWL